MNITNELTPTIEKLESYITSTSNPEAKEAAALMIRDLYAIAVDATMLSTFPEEVIKKRKKKNLFNL